MREVIVRMPRKHNRFTGRCTMGPSLFEDLKELVGIGKLVIVHQDEAGNVKGASSRLIEQWMVDSAILKSGERGDFYVVTFSKNVYLRSKNFKSKQQYMTDEQFSKRLQELNSPFEISKPEMGVTFRVKPKMLRGVG